MSSHKGNSSLGRDVGARVDGASRRLSTKRVASPSCLRGLHPTVAIARLTPPPYCLPQKPSLALIDSRMKKPVRPLRAALTLVLAAALLSVAFVVWRQANPGAWTFPTRMATLTLVSQTVAGRPTSSQDTAAPGRAPTPVPALSPTATAVPTATPPPTLTPTAIPAPTIAPAPPLPPTPASLHRVAQPAVRLAGLRHEWQTWNNCGPATLAMLMSFFGSQLDQATAGAALRLSADDKNVSPQEFVAFARSQGYAADLYVNGSRDRRGRCSATTSLC